MFPNQRERPLLQSELGAFLNADLRTLGMAPVSGEDGNVRIDPKGIIAPVSRRDHPAVKVEDASKLPTIESGDWLPVPGTRERRDDAQALFTLGWG